MDKIYFLYLSLIFSYMFLPFYFLILILSLLSILGHGFVAIILAILFDSVLIFTTDNVFSMFFITYIVLLVNLIVFVKKSILN